MHGQTLENLRQLRAFGWEAFSEYADREDLERSDISWLLWNSDRYYSTAGHTVALRAAADWCQRGNTIGSDQLQPALFLVARYDERARSAQTASVRRLVATEDSWDFATRALPASVRLDVLAAASIAGSRSATERWLALVLRDPPSVADLVLNLTTQERELFIALAPSWNGATSSLLGNLRSITAPAA